MPRPIELHSHDPLRYVGDILAWLHQACASENEHLTTLLRLCADKGQSRSLVQCTVQRCKGFYKLSQVGL